MTTLDVNNNNLLQPPLKDANKRNADSATHPQIEITIATPREDIRRRASRATINIPATRDLESRQRRKSRRSVKSANPRKKSIKRDELRAHSVAVADEPEGKDKWKEYARQNVDKILENLESKSKDKWASYVNKELKKHSEQLVKDMEKKIPIKKIAKISEESDTELDKSDEKRKRKHSKHKETRKKKEEEKPVPEKPALRKKASGSFTKSKPITEDKIIAPKPAKIIDNNNNDTKKPVVTPDEKTTPKLAEEVQDNPQTAALSSQINPSPPQITTSPEETSTNGISQLQEQNKLSVANNVDNNEPSLKHSPRQLQRQNTEDHIQNILSVDDPDTNKKPRPQRIPVVLSPGIIPLTEEESMKKLEDSILIRHEKKKDANEVDKLIQDLQITT